MRHLKVLGLVAVVAAALTISPAGDSEATPGLGGTVIFSTAMIGPAHDISAAPMPPGVTCTSADILAAPGTGPVGPCAPRVLPAPPGPVPWGVTGAALDLGLNFGGPFTDDLDALSFGEAAVGGPLDIDFSVDPAPANGGVTTGAPVPPPCAGPFPVNVTTEAAMLQAQGDVFTWSAAFPGPCNTQSTDEAALGLIAPNPGAPGIPPLDNMDALAEFAFVAGPCAVVAGTFATSCGTYSVTAASPVLAGIAPDPFTLALVTGGTILAQPGAPPAPPALPGGCPPAGLPCAAVGFPMLGLTPMDDVDALCWYDVLANGAPDLPLMPGVPGDIYVYSLTPASPSAVGFGGPAALVRAGGVAPAIAVLAPPATMGLLPTDDVDGIICHDADSDGDVVPDFADNCDFDADPTLADSDGDTVGDVCDNCPTTPNAAQTDTDSDGVGNVCDNCPSVANGGQANSDSDGFGDACDNCPTVTNADQADSDGDGVGTACDNCPTVVNPGQANADGDAWGDACDNCPAVATPWMVPVGDGDCDGFTTVHEGLITTDPGDACGFTPGAPTQSETWPPDLAENNAVNTVDVLALKPVFGTLVPPTSARFDLAPNGTINIADVLVMKPFSGKACTP